MSIDQVLSVLEAAVGVILDHPWSLVPIAIVVLVCTALASPAGGATDSRDPRRTFTAAERREAFERAGLRCEHKPLLWHRCANTPKIGRASCRERVSMSAGAPSVQPSSGSRSPPPRARV